METAGCEMAEEMRVMELQVYVRIFKLQSCFAKHNVIARRNLTQN